MVKKISKIKKTIQFEKNIKVKDNRVDFSKEGRKKTDTKRSWDTELPDMNGPKKDKFANNFLIISIAFFILAITASIFLFKGNVVSGDNIEIDLQTDINITSGDTVKFEVSITNKNTVAIASTDLAISLPKGSYRKEKPSEGSTVHRKSIGSLSPGETKEYVFNVVLFGTEDDVQEVDIEVDYRLDGSNAQFAINKVFDLLISDSPISVTLEAPEEYVSGSEMELIITLSSNSSKVIDDVVVSAEYPFGFNVISTNKKGNSENTFWEIGDLIPNQKIRIIVKGILEGQDREERTFRFTTGVGKNNEEIESVIAKSKHTLFISRPFIELQLSLDESNDDPYIAERGKEIDGTLFWENNTQNVLRDVEVELTIFGEAVDYFSVDSRNGFYDEKERTIKWSDEEYKPFESIAPGARGNVRFSFITNNIQPLDNIGSQKISLIFDILGEEVGQNQKNINERIKRDILLNSTTSLITTVNYSTGRFSNSGPIPPRIGEETTYNIKIDINNKGNELKNGILRTSIPSYVSLSSAIYPDSEDIQYNEEEKEILWNIGTIASDGKNSYKKIEFQVSIIPTLQHINIQPILVKAIELEYFDVFINKIVRKQNSPLKTTLEGDIGGRSGFVVE